MAGTISAPVTSSYLTVTPTTVTNSGAVTVRPVPRFTGRAQSLDVLNFGLIGAGTSSTGARAEWLRRRSDRRQRDPQCIRRDDRRAGRRRHGERARPSTTPARRRSRVATKGLRSRSAIGRPLQRRHHQRQQLRHLRRRRRNRRHQQRGHPDQCRNRPDRRQEQLLLWLWRRAIRLSADTVVNAGSHRIRRHQLGRGRSCSTAATSPTSPARVDRRWRLGDFPAGLRLPSGRA